MIQGKIIRPGEDWSAVKPIRLAVFVEEQQIPQELEFDDKDDRSIHVVILDDGKVVGTGRLYETEKDGVCQIGRIAVLKEYRKKGYGDFIVRLLLDQAFITVADEVVVHAQLPVVPFYEKIGFQPFGEPFTEDGIEHISMRIHEKEIRTLCGRCQA